MSKNVEKEQQTTEAPVASSPTAESQQQQTAPRSLEIDESNVVTSYANFCRVTGTPEELIVDFGLNTQPMNDGQKPVVINQRIVLNFYTAKRLLAALQVSVQRHEAVFGVLETDVQRRVQPIAQKPQ